MGPGFRTFCWPQLVQEVLAVGWADLGECPQEVVPSRPCSVLGSCLVFHPAAPSPTRHPLLCSTQFRPGRRGIEVAQGLCTQARCVRLLCPGGQCWGLSNSGGCGPGASWAADLFPHRALGPWPLGSVAGSWSLGEARGCLLGPGGRSAWAAV